MRLHGHHLLQIILFLCLVSVNPSLYGEGARTQTGKKTATILISTDTSGLNLTTALQYALAQLFRNMDQFMVQLSAYVLPGFSPVETQKAHQVLVTDVFSFVYMEKERISIFLFNKDFPGQFIVSSQSLFDSPQQQLTTLDIERKLQASFINLFKMYRNNQYQYLPGASPQVELAESDEEIKKRQSLEAKHLYRELANIQEKAFYLGANVGMARFGASESSTSVVNFGGFMGYNLSKRLGLEASLDVFSYALASLNARYRLPVSDKYVFFNLALGASQVLVMLTENRGSQSDLKVGRTLFGPGFSFDVPLLGTHIRGGINLYFGSGTILIGNYGVSYSVSL